MMWKQKSEWEKFLLSQSKNYFKTELTKNGLFCIEHNLNGQNRIYFCYELLEMDQYYISFDSLGSLKY